MLKRGSIILSIWSGINIFLASLILIIIIFLNGNAPILVMVFEKSEITGLDARVISSVNALAILYNSCDVALSVLALFIIWSGLINGKRWAFWALLITIGFVEILAFVASAEVGNARWQVNVVQSILYIVGIGLSGYALFKGDKNEYDQRKSPWDKQKDRNWRRRLIYAKINHNKEIKNEFNQQDFQNFRLCLPVSICDLD